jgi:signal transduction histidine kinase
MVTLPVIVDQWFTLSAKLRTSAPPAGLQPQGVPVALWALELALCVGFGAAFWRNTGSIGARKPAWTAVILLVFQMALSTFAPELAYLVAAELPFMMPLRQALKWLAVQSAALVVLVAVALAAGDFAPADALLHTPLAISVPGTILYMLAWMGFAFGAGYLASSEARTRRELARANSELMATQALLSDGTRVAERLRISRELHDVVGHHLAGLSVNLQLALHLAEGQAAEPPVREAHTVAKLLLAEVREVVGTLRDRRQSDLRRALQLLAGGVAEPRIHLDLPADLDRVDPLCSHVLFRCVQEAITNAIKHSGARNLWVELQPGEAGWDMLVRDDGRGAASIAAGNGLKGMAERLEEVGGQLKLESQPGEGFTLRASIRTPGALA